MQARCLTYEWIGYSRRNDYWWLPKRERPYRRPWVARIIGTDAQRGLIRDFQDGVLDYTQSDPSGRRGVRVVYIVNEGDIYEADYPINDGWSRAREYLTHTGEAWVKLSRDEVIAWANVV